VKGNQGEKHSRRRWHGSKGRFHAEYLWQEVTGFSVHWALKNSCIATESKTHACTFLHQGVRSTA